MITTRLAKSIFTIFTSISFVLINTNTIYAASDIIFSNKDLQINQGQYIYFPHSSQSNGNDGKIGAGIFNPGLNIVGIKTDTTFRKLSLWGEITQQQNGGKNTWLGINYFGGSVGIGTATPGTTLDVAGNIWTALGDRSAGTDLDITGGRMAAGSSIYSYGDICTQLSMSNCTGTQGVNIGNTKTDAYVNITNSTTSFFNSTYVSIGTTTPVGHLTVNGNILANNYVITPGTNYYMAFNANTHNKISMGNASYHLYGPVGDYSIKNSLHTTDVNGWTWGAAGITPVMSLQRSSGNLQVAGQILAEGNITTAGIIEGSSNAYIAGALGIGGTIYGYFSAHNTAGNGDGIVINPDYGADDRTIIQTYINNLAAGGWENWGYAGGCCNMLYINKDAGDLSFGNARGVTVSGPLTVNSTINATQTKHFFARANQHTLNAGDTVNWSSVQENVGGFTNGGTLIYPPENGTYLIAVNLSTKTTNACRRFSWYVTKNGTAIQYADTNNGVGEYGNSTVLLATDLTTAQYISVRISWELGDQSCYIYGADVLTTLSISKMN